MKRTFLRVFAQLLAIWILPALAQQAPSSAANNPVPTLVQFGGVLIDEAGKPMSGVVGVTFLLYKEQQGGAPVWLETQNVQPDKTGHYSVMLGSTSAYGLPSDIFAAGEARWLAVQPQGQPEQTRVMLLSVPYALKAGDAETVGGLPASAFVLATPGGVSASTGAATPNSASSIAAAGPPAGSSNVTTTGGTINLIPLWTTSTNIQNSALSQTGSGSTAKIGVNTVTPAATLDVKGTANVEGQLTQPPTGTATAAKGFNSQPHSWVASAFNSSSSTAVPQKFQWQAEPVGNDTSSPSGTLNLLYGAGTSSPAETGLKINNQGQISFASGQSFPGTGTISGVTTAAGSGLTGGGTSGTLNLGLTACSANQILQFVNGSWTCSSAATGTVTSVASGAGLTGGPITGSGTLSIANGGVSNAMLTNPSLTVAAGAGLTGGGVVPLGGAATLNLDTTKVPLLNAPNIFTGNQTVNGYVNASSYDIAGTPVVSISPGLYNLYLGQSAGQGAGANNTGSSNTTAGYQALFLNTSGSSNAAAGNQALYNNTTGTGNAAAGNQALYSNTTGGYNTAHGDFALHNNTTGSSNTALGDLALSPNTTGSGNVGVGTVAGGASPNSAFTTGSLDTYLGSYTTSGTQTNLTNATAIGANAEVTASNAMVLGSINGVNGATSNVNVGIGTTAPAATLDVHGTGNFTGPITFAPGQVFPGSGTITGVTAGSGLTGGGNSGTVTLSVDLTKVVTMVNPGTGLMGGGSGTPTLSVDSMQVPLLNAANNTFNGNQNVNGNLSIVNNANYQPLAVQSSSTFGTWANLINTSTGGKQWSILSAGGANAEGAGNLAVTNFTGNSNIYLEGNVKANTLSVNNDTPMSSNPHMVFSGFMAGNLGNYPNGGYFVPDRNITITRVSAAEGSLGQGCSNDSFVTFWNDQTNTIIYSLDLIQNISNVDSGPINVPVAAGTQIGFNGQAASGCGLFGSSPSNVFVNVQYVMQ